MKLILSLMLAMACSAHALETDNYLSWGVNLPDSGEDINRLIQTQIEEVLESSARKNLSCAQVTFRIANRFKTTPRRKLFEDWSIGNLSGKMFPETPFYLKKSIYRNSSRVYLSKSGLSPNIQTNGIYFGVDKLSHFGSTGRRYLKEFLKKIRKGYSSEDAEKAAIHMGLDNEAGILGLWPSGVFSYGDMEANFQGFRFYKSFCMGEGDNYLEQENGRWKLVKIPDIREFVSPYWDESFNLSWRAGGMWAVSSKIILQEYCPMIENKELQSRFKYYQEFVYRSRSLDYIEELQSRGYTKAPNPSRYQSIDKLCQTPP